MEEALIHIIKSLKELTEDNIKARNENEKIRKEIILHTEEILNTIKDLKDGFRDIIMHIEERLVKSIKKSIATQTDDTSMTPKSICGGQVNYSANVRHTIKPDEKTRKTTCCPKSREVRSWEHKVFIICDEYGRDINSTMQEMLNNKKYLIETVIKPDAAFHQMVQYLPQLTKHYGMNDFIVIITGFQNFYRNNEYYISKDILKKVQLCLNSHIIITTVPYVNPKLNKYVYKFNENIKESVCKFNEVALGTISVVDVNKYNNKKMNKFELANVLVGKILHISSKDNNKFSLPELSKHLTVK